MSDQEYERIVKRDLHHELEAKDRLIRELVKSLKECRDAIDNLMGDTDPADETPVLLACQNASRVLASARAQGYEP